ncbi:hypothetical protein BH10PSE2_BH10PSE2_17690 [soil metagenome]
MPNQLSDARAKRSSNTAERSAADGAGPQAKEYPVREYIGSMAQELAQMARWDGDECLAVLLDAVVNRAAETGATSVPARPATATPRPA